jgi:hypothetical protein
MLRRSLATLTLIGILGFAAAAHAATPEGPRLGFERVVFKVPKDFHDFNDLKPSTLFDFQLVSTGPLGGDRRGIFKAGPNGRPAPVGGAGWSPDGSLVAFGGLKNGLQEDGDSPSDIYVVGADDSGLRRLTRFGDAGHPVFAADGQSIYFARAGAPLSGANGRASNGPAYKPKGSSKTALLAFVLRSYSLWQINLDGSGLRQLTPADASVADYPSSVSVATGQVAYTRVTCPGGSCHQAARVFSPQSGVDAPLADDGFNPVFSPDGRHLLIDSYRDRNWPKHAFKKNRVAPAAELYVLDAASGSVQRLTFTRGITEEAGFWDPSGQRIAYSQFGYRGSKVFELNVDGSCRTGLPSKKGFGDTDLFGWRPGPGREAGPLAC